MSSESMKESADKIIDIAKQYDIKEVTIDATGKSKAFADYLREGGLIVHE